MITGMQKYIRSIGVAVAGLALAGGAEAQVARKADAKAVAAMIDRAFPKWDEPVLKVDAGRNWIAELSLQKVLSATKDKAVQEKEPPTGAKRFQEGNTVVKIDRQQGKVRYINRDRNWSHDKRSTELPDENRAKDTVIMALKEMGFPAEEVADVRIKTQIAAGAAPGERKTREELPMYRFLIVTRKVKNIPVYDSKVHVAVAAKNEIQRLQIIWPTFQLTPDLALRSREEVINDAVAQIMRQDPSADIKIEAKLAYAPIPYDDEELRFMPAIIASVYSPPTPYQLVIPIADTGKAKH